MAKKSAYQTYTRDKNGELRVQLVDAVTGKPVKNPKEYEIIDSTEAQGQELTGLEPETDAPVKNIKPSTSTFRNPEEIRRSQRDKQGDRGYGKGVTKGGKHKPGTAADNFGFIQKPGWSKYASTAAGLLGGPVAGMAVGAANMGVNAKNVQAVNDAREALGLKPMSTKDIVKGIVKGVDEGAVGEVDIGNNAKRNVSLSDAVIDGKTQMTPREAQDRRALASTQAAAKRDKANFNPASKLHPELSPSNVPSLGKKGKGLAGVTKNSPMEGLDMVDGYRARLASVDFDKFGLDPVTKEKAKEFQAEAARRNLDLAIDVKDMVRSPTRQKEIQAAGFSKTKKSEHMAAMALDISPVDDQDQAGWAAKRSLAESLGWGQLDPSWDPAHMGLTKSNTQPGALNMTKEDAIASRDYFGNVPVSNENRQRLGLQPDIPTPMDRPTVARSIVNQAKTPKTDFYSQQYAYAKEAGLTGVMADVAVAQAAMETGYGTGVLNKEANNYHGIKAGKTWAGPTYTTPSNEEVNGIMAPETSAFRAYETPVDSYKDWKSVMEKNFPGVVTAKSLPEAITGLENGVLGKYATDSKYGAKLTKAYEEATAANQMTPTVDDSRYSIDNPKTPSFEKYSKSFYDKVQRESLPGISEPPDNMGRVDSPSSGRPSFGANRPASMGMGSGRPSGPTSSNTFGGGAGRSSVGSGSYAGSRGGQNSPSEGGSRFGGAGLGQTSGASKSTSTAGLGSGRPSGPTGSNTSNKDKDKSQGPSGGGYGGWGGPH